MFSSGFVGPHGRSANLRDARAPFKRHRKKPLAEAAPSGLEVQDRPERSQPDGGNMTHDEIKQKMIWAGKVLVAEGQDDFTRGHISMRLPDNPNLFFMKPHSLG